MSEIKVGTIKKHRLSKHDEKIWSNFMTPEYVYETGTGRYINLRFMGYDKMEQEWKIVPKSTQTNLEGGEE